MEDWPPPILSYIYSCMHTKQWCSFSICSTTCTLVLGVHQSYSTGTSMRIHNRINSQLAARSCCSRTEADAATGFLGLVKHFSPLTSQRSRVTCAVSVEECTVVLRSIPVQACTHHKHDTRHTATQPERVWYSYGTIST